VSERYGEPYLISIWDLAFKEFIQLPLVQNVVDYVLMLLPRPFPPPPPPHQAKEDKSKRRRRRRSVGFLSIFLWGKFWRSFLLKISPLWLGSNLKIQRKKNMSMLYEGIIPYNYFFSRGT
jgi:hypothetical protein